MPHTFRRLALPALPRRPFCLVRRSGKSSFSMAITVTPWHWACLTRQLTASLSAPRRCAEEPSSGMFFSDGSAYRVAVNIQHPGVDVPRVEIYCQAPA